MRANAEALLAEAAGGDVDAFEALYDLFERPVYSISLRTVKDKQKAEEVTQDAFLKVWRSAQAFDASKGSAAAWIFTLAKRSAIDVLRKETRTPVPSEIVDDSASPDSTDELWATWQVNLALGTLPEDQRRVIELFVITGFTHKEIASKLALPLGTVKTRIYSGLKHLRQAIASEEIAGWSL